MASIGGGPATPELVGRQAAWESIRAAFEDAARGRLRLALCVGDPGIGKSHLLAVAAERLASAGARVLQGGASEAEAMPPYLPFLEALGPWIRQAPIEQLLSDVGSGALVLTTVFPDLTAARQRAAARRQGAERHNAVLRRPNL